MKLKVAVLLASVAVSCTADQLFLKDDVGTSYGPFELEEGAKVQVGEATATVSRIRTDEAQVYEAMSRIIIPKIEFREADIHEAIRFLQEDSLEFDNKKQGVQFVLDHDPTPGKTNDIAAADQAALAPAITFKASDISVLEALRIIANLTGFKYVVKDGVVALSPLCVPDGPIVRRMFRLATNVVNRLSDEEHADLKQFFGWLGVTWPRGSSLDYVPELEKLIVANTRRNLAVIQEMLQNDCVLGQIEVQLCFVAFDLTNIARLASSPIDASALTRLWTNGHGTLLAAPRVVTMLGVQATVKGITECIYPTDYTISPVTSAHATSSSSAPASTNQPVTDRGAPVPGNFETREVGAIFTVLPEVSPEGQTISLTIVPELVEEPTWRQYSAKYEDSSGAIRLVTQEQPFFHSYSATTTLSLKNGATILAGGGMPSRNGSQMVYIFVTARLVDVEGEPINPPTEDEEL